MSKCINKKNNKFRETENVLNYLSISQELFFNNLTKVLKILYFNIFSHSNGK